MSYETTILLGAIAGLTIFSWPARGGHQVGCEGCDSAAAGHRRGDESDLDGRLTIHRLTTCPPRHSRYPVVMFHSVQPGAD
jgi:hypothetical protein